ncbi:DUF4157 domain-containing protein [Streptomyces sp. NPDC001652]|uniref:DUF4157 domain-containing protein n=1 Tax=Streptomyces sp. NPDC001652 TaxID=3154393 RepID=UPI0033328DF8
MSLSPAPTTARAITPHSVARPVSRPHDPSEREADRAADEVVRGGTVRGWSFTTASLSAPVQRQEAEPGHSEQDKLKEALGVALGAASKTEQAASLAAKAQEDPLVGRVSKALATPMGKAGLVSALTTAVGVLAATGHELPIPVPDLELSSHVTLQITHKGPVGAPIALGVTLKYEEPPTARPKASRSDRARAETARLLKEQEAFRRGMRFPPGSAEAEERRLWNETVAHSQGTLPGITTPLVPPGKRTEEPPAEQRRLPDDAPVQRSYDPAATPATATSHPAAGVSAGHPLDPGVRHLMEARFGHDFSRVRIHDDTGSAAVARSLGARAFTVGESVYFAAGRYDPHGTAGQRLIAHELAHVVQQSGGGEVLARSAETEVPVTAPHDATEREAERVADRVSADEDHEYLDSPDPGPGSPPPPGLVHPSCDVGPCTTPPGFLAAVTALEESGVPLPAAPLRHMERRLGTSFAAVRLHRGAEPDRLARSVDAQAFTWGDHIHLAATAPDPVTREGRHLLAHELVHVRQGRAEQRVRRTVRRTRALYISTHGKKPFLRDAEEYHRTHGFPEPVHVSSVEELLEHLVTLTPPLDNVRIVSHAVTDGIFLSLLRGGTSTLFRQDLTLQSQEGLESELAVAHPTERDGSVVEVEHHVVPREWTTAAYERIRADHGGERFLREHRFPETMQADGDLQTWLWWILDRELLTATRESGRGRGRSHLLPIEGELRKPGHRNEVTATLDRNAGIYRDLALMHLRRGLDEVTATEAVAEFERRAAAVVVDVATDAGQQGGGRFPVNGPSREYSSVQGALERGAYANNLLRAKSMIPDGMPFEIRGCNIGQNTGWLEAFRDFWGLGVRPMGKRPDVSAPDLTQRYAWRNGDMVEALGEKGALVFGGTPEFDQHIIHAR